MQVRLSPTETPSPLPTTAASYVPSLLDRPGERDALACAPEAVWGGMTPIVHFHGPSEAPEVMKSQQFTAWSKRIADAMGEHLFYLDLSRPSPKTKVRTGKGDVPIQERLYEAMRKRGARFIPVAMLGLDFDIIVNSVANCAINDGLGLAVRYRFREVAFKPGESHRSRLESRLESLGVPAEDTDLFIDLAYIGPDDEFDVENLAREIEMMVATAAWRSVVLLGTSMPPMLSCVKEGTVGEIDRQEWTLWRELKDQNLARPLAYGDYAIQGPAPPSGGPGMRRSIRYTASDTTVIARAKGAVTEADNRQYRELCEWLLDRPEIRPKDYSWGDETIAGCAAGLRTPTGQEMWRGAGTSHHFQLVTDQLRAG